MISVVETQICKLSTVKFAPIVYRVLHFVLPLHVLSVFVHLSVVLSPIEEVGPSYNQSPRKILERLNKQVTPPSSR